MRNLSKRVTFLESAQPQVPWKPGVNALLMTKRLSADDETATDKVTNLQQEYAMRKAQMGDAIQKVIDNSKIARV